MRLEIGGEIIRLSTIDEAEEYYLSASHRPWEKDVFRKFCKDLMDENEPFPCVLGVHGLIMGELEFTFVPREDKKTLTQLASALRSYVESSRTYGRNTSFVAFFEPESVMNIEEYEQQFWTILNRLHRIDEWDWPEDISTSPENPLWEFCFHGEPMFVVCNTPTHKKRKSRSSHCFMITFQPRFVFDDVNGRTKRGKHIQKIVRNHIKSYDDVEPHPDLKWFGEQGAREWKQYFIYDDNKERAGKCPFHFKGGEAMLKTKIETRVGGSMDEVIDDLLPIGKTGCVEVQRDLPNKAHRAHSHPKDEILHIVNGSLTFIVGNEQFACTTGDRISLPKDREHSSVAGPHGCTYVIAVLD